jgi:hypothetical protein
MNRQGAKPGIYWASSPLFEGWGLKVIGYIPKVGDKVTVTTLQGKTTVEIIKEIHRSGTNKSGLFALCSIEGIQKLKVSPKQFLQMRIKGERGRIRE